MLLDVGCHNDFPHTWLSLENLQRQDLGRGIQLVVLEHQILVSDRHVHVGMDLDFKTLLARHLILFVDEPSVK